MNNSTFNTEAALSAADLTDALAKSSLNIEPDVLSKALSTVNSWVIAEKNVEDAKNDTAIAFLDMGFAPTDLRARTAEVSKWELSKAIIKRSLPQPTLDLIAASETAKNRVELEEAAGMGWASAKGKVNSLCGKLAGQMQLEQDKRDGKVCRITGNLLDTKDATHRKHLKQQGSDLFDKTISKIEALAAKCEADPEFAKSCGKCNFQAAGRMITAARVAFVSGTLPTWYPKK